MELQCNKNGNGIGLIKLNGRLDIIGTGEIETKFTGYYSGDNRFIGSKFSCTHWHSVAYDQRQIHCYTWWKDCVIGPKPGCEKRA